MRSANLELNHLEGDRAGFEHSFTTPCVNLAQSIAKDSKLETCVDGLYTLNPEAEPLSELFASRMYTLWCDHVLRIKAFLG